MDPDDEMGPVTRVFLDARALEPGARAAFLDLACRGDVDLRREVESLLAHDDTLEVTASILDPPPVIPGYQVIQKIGEGGMGEVWLARQNEPVQRDVAIKVIKAGMDTKQVVARFEAERQALALMEHPGIAKVFAAGETSAGRPFFVMEYVRGEAITAYADRHKLGLEERLALFVEVCEAVQHAHQKGVIHRDLKPSNVLVTVHGRRSAPKIIDFGVAKATAQRLTERSLFTELGMLVGTPEYMSPEQAELTALDVDTRTDVYSLGVILYELLAGALPFDSRELRSAGYDEIRRRIREDEPVTPSARLSTLGPSSKETAQNRRSEPQLLRRQLRGDLDWITMRALEKDRTRRYQSASDLAADVERHQRNEPVLAGPPSASYKLGKFVRRNRVGVAAGLVVLIAIVGGFAASAVGFVRARRAEQRARQEAETATQVTGFLEELFETSDPFKADKNTITLREVLDRGAERVNRELGASPRVRARLLGTIGSVYVQLNQPEQALPILRESLRITEVTAGPNDPETAAALLRLARDYSDPRRLWLTQRAVAILERTLGPNHVDTGYALSRLADAWWATAEARPDAMQREEAFRNRALSVLEANLGPDDPGLTETLAMHAYLLRRQRRYAEAEQVVFRALAIQEKTFGVGHPNTVFSLNTLGNICMLSRQYAKAEEAHAKAFAIFKKIYDAPPRNTAYLADAKMGLGKFDEAIALLETQQTYWEGRTAPEWDDVLGQNRARLMLAYKSAGRNREARATYEKLFRQRETEDSNSSWYSFPKAKYWLLDGDRSRAIACLRLALADGFGEGEQIDWFRDRELAALQGDPEFEAIVADATLKAEVALAKQRRDFDGEEALYKKALDANPDDYWALVNEAIVLRDRRKDYTAAETLFSHAIDVAPNRILAREGLAILYEKTGSHDDRAQGLYEGVIASRPEVPDWQANHALFLLGRGLTAEGLVALDKAIGKLTATSGWGVQAECWFYAFCFRPEPARGAALVKLKELVVANNARSVDWDMSRLVAQAVEAKHPDAQWLNTLAAVINDVDAPEALDDWPAWAAIHLDP